MENLNNPNPGGGNMTNRPASCNPFTVEFTTDTQLHESGSQQYVESTDVKIGRAQDCEIRFGDDCVTVSRNHAQIKCSGGIYILEHLSESNPTFVNGKNVTKQYILAHRDIIQISEGGPKILFMAPSALGSNSPNIEQPEQKTVRGGATASEQTHRPSTSNKTAHINYLGANCLPFTIEFEKKSQLNYPGQRKTISETEVLIGRASNAVIRFGDDCSDISTEHAIIRCEEGKWYLEHKSRTNPTYLNSKPVTGKEELTHNSIIHLSSLSGQSIRFYLSGASGNTGRVQGGTTSYSGGTAQAPQPSLSTRFGEMISIYNRKQRFVTWGLLGGLLITIGLLGWNWYKSQRDIKSIVDSVAQEKKEQEKRDSIRVAEEKLKIFPESDFEPFIFFSKSHMTIKIKNKTYGPDELTGTAFLDNKGNLITARHVINKLEFPDDGIFAFAQIMQEQGIASIDIKKRFESPISKSTITNPKFKGADTKPIYNKKFRFEKQIIEAKTCSPNEDWAVATPPELSKLAQESTIEVDINFSKTIGTSTELYTLGYKDSKGGDPQPKHVLLDYFEPVEGDFNETKMFKVNEPTFGPGDSGSPVFAFNPNKKKWVVVGMVIMRENYWGSDSKWGIILPIYEIDNNYF